MNTVKRWLAGLLSFAMIFTSSAFGNVGTVFASSANPQQKADGDVAKVTIDNTVTYWESMDLAVAQANAALNNENGYKKTIIIDLLDDAEIDWYHRSGNWPNYIYSGVQVNIPLTINMNGFSLAETHVDEYWWGGYSIGTTDYNVCPSYVYNDAILTSIKFATHNPAYTFNWELDTDAKTWSVVSYREKCPNCGDGGVDVDLADDGRFNHRASTTSLYRNNHPVLSGYFRTDFDVNSNTYKFNQYEDEDFEDFVKTWSVLNAKEGYALPSNPTFDADGTMLKHDADGKPIVIAKIYVMADGSTVENPDVTITAATNTEMRNAGTALNNPDSADYGYYQEEVENIDPFNPPTSIANAEATCTSYGIKWYRVVVKDPNGKVLFDKLMVDYQADGIQDHKEGEIRGAEVLTRGGSGYDTEAEALAAAGDTPVVKIKKDHIDWNDDGDYDDPTDFDGYYYWYWAGLNEIPTTGYNLNNRQRQAYNDNRDIISRAVDETGAFQFRYVYSCYWVDGDPDRTTIYGEAKPAVLLPDLGTDADDITAANQARVDNDRPRTGNASLDTRGNSKFSTCLNWNYEDLSAKSSYIRDNGTQERDRTFSLALPAIQKAKKAYSHDPGNNTVTKTTGNCYTPSTEDFQCAICNTRVIVDGEKTNDHKFVAIKPADANGLTVQDIDRNLTEKKEGTNESAHQLTWNSDYSKATISATCTEDGGEYQYCCNGENPQGTYGTGAAHWVCTKVISATGHKLSMVALTPDWNEFGNIKPYFTENHPYSYNGYSNKYDYQFYTTMTCENENCSKHIHVRIHSIDGTDTITKTENQGFYTNGAGIAEIYNGIDVVKQKEGKDCLTNAKIIWTVKDVVDANKKPVTKEADSGSAKGPHTLENITWKWSEDFKQATGTGTCTLCKESGQTVEVTTEQTTTADGITTFTAKNGNESESKKAYSLKDAVVTFDKSLVTDFNLLNGIEGAASQAPDVTVTINGTVIDPSLYDVDWKQVGNNGAYAQVDWTEDVKASTTAAHVEATAKSETVQVEAKNRITNVKFELYANDEYTNDWDNEYDPAVTYTIKTSSKPSNVTVKYAVLDKKVTADKKEPGALQKKIESLKFDKDKVELKEVGKYYVYAQITKDGYTTYTSYVAPSEYYYDGAVIDYNLDDVLPVVITAKEISVYVDNTEMTVGETPVLKKQAYDSKGKKVDIDWDAENFVFATAGNVAFEDLTAGTYLIWADAPNYIIRNASSSGDDRIGTIVVKPKTDAQKAADDIVKMFKEAQTDDQKAAAYAAYLAITDKDVKAIVDAAIAADKELKAKVEACKAAKEEADRKAAEEEAKKKAEKELADAKAAATAAINSAKGYESDAGVKAALDALNKVKDGTDTNAIKTATANLNNAVVAAKKAAEPKNSNITISTGKKTVYTGSKKNKKLKKKQSFKIKYSKTGDGAVSFKKLSGSSKKLSISKSGKITVKKNTKAGKYKIKVQANIAGTKNYKAASAKKTITVTVKKGKKKKK